MVDKVTVDTLPLSTSEAYARRQQELEGTSIVQDSRTIPQKVETPVTTPHAPSEYQSKFGLGEPILWAAVSPPPDSRGSALLFTFQLIPTLGSEDEQQALLDKVTAMAPSLSKEQDVQVPYKKILSCLNLLHQLDRTFDLINGRRLQYHKG